MVGISDIHQTDNAQMTYLRKQLTKADHRSFEEDEKTTTHQRKYSDYHVTEKDNSKEIEDLKQEVKKWKYNYKHLEEALIDIQTELGKSCEDFSTLQ